MNRNYLVCLLSVFAFCLISFTSSTRQDYRKVYDQSLIQFGETQEQLLNAAANAAMPRQAAIDSIKWRIKQARLAMKAADFWLRYLDPLAYKQINGPLPVEWETEVFEKFEKPYRRDGAGLTLAALYLAGPDPDRDSLLALIRRSTVALEVYNADTLTKILSTPDHFFFCNRLFLLNLAAIYTTGFDAPGTDYVIPELKAMLEAVANINTAFNASFPATALPPAYLSLYAGMTSFVAAQPADYTAFDHFEFLKRYVNPLFIINQKLIAAYQPSSHNLLDYTLNANAASIFSKELYNGQNARGIFLRVKDEAALAQIEEAGRLLFYDPLLSGNNRRSCASCHQPSAYFTDTTTATAVQYNGTDHLSRNAPSLINAGYNHLIMQDGKHTGLQNQTKDVISNLLEMNCKEDEVVKKVMSCKKYRTLFRQLLKYTPQETDVTYDHIVSALTSYYTKFSNYSAPFDDAMNGNAGLDANARAGFNLFMGKAKCATCHFVPQFNGVKPPYIGSEFEVVGVPADTAYKALSADNGRYGVFAARETMNAFRTGTVRNAAHTRPYMHNGVFGSLVQVIDFYNSGGGAGHGLSVANQTLSPDSLHLTNTEKDNLIAFIKSLDEKIIFETPPTSLPASADRQLNARKVGGEY